ncbi:MAG: hypothetical protein O3A92_06970 [Verrucomicrobia bacterium]|nr:hypothetical protein [Verrucomicrobiota bacterium]
MNHPKGLKNITRNIAENCVVLRFRRQHKNWHYTFAISKYGGSWEKAEAAAKRKRGEVIKTLPEALTRKGVMSHRNSSGVVGVHFAEKKHVAPSGRVYWYPHFYAKWPGCPKRAGIGWSVNQYGFEDAFVLAVLSREMESVDRKKIVATHKRILKQARYKKILAQLELVYE